MIFLSDKLGRYSLCFFCCLQLRRETDLHSHYAYYEVLKTNYKYLNLPENRCSDKETYLDGPSVTECVEGFIEQHLKCSIPWHNFRTGRDECTLEDQFLRYAEVSEQLANLDEQQIWELTGCMRPCDQTEYRGAIQFVLLSWSKITLKVRMSAILLSTLSPLKVGYLTTITWLAPD